jgi:hypothetical protein
MKTKECQDSDFERLKYFFWTYLERQTRIEVLVKVGCLPNTGSQSIPQTVEHLALRVAGRNEITMPSDELLCHLLLMQLPNEAFQEALESLVEIWEFHQESHVSSCPQSPPVSIPARMGKPIVRPVFPILEGM